MITMKRYDKNHFLLTSSEPMRIEVIKDEGTNNIVSYVYKGITVENEQEPDMCYDGNEGEKERNDGEIEIL